MDIIVTGASRGIGFEIVKEFSALPGNTIIAIARNKEYLERLKSVCKSKRSGRGVEVIQADLTDTVCMITDLIPRIQKILTRIDILINNAGYLINRPFENIQPLELENIFNINLKVPFLFTQALMNMLKNANKPHVINISSMGGVHGSIKFPGLSAYSSAKGGLGILTECLAEEYQDFGISFNCLALGAVHTEMFAEAFPGHKAPLNPREIARFIVDFAINGHKFFNGKILPVSISTP